MAKLPETSRYEADIYQIEKTDPVVGGRDGLSNRQATQLGNRTGWLKQKVDQLSGRWSSALSALNAHKADTTAHPPRATKAQGLGGQDNAGYMTALRVKEVMDAQASYSPTAVVHADNVSVGRVNDYRSGNSAQADILQLARSSDFDLTGIADGVVGKELRVQCTGGGDVTLVHNSTRSATGNRIWLSPSAYPAGEVKLQQGDTASLLYMRYNAGVGHVWVLTGVTQASVPEATTTVKGVVRFATEQEARAGTAMDSAITPALLSKVNPKMSISDVTTTTIQSRNMPNYLVIPQTGRPTPVPVSGGKYHLKKGHRYLVVQGNVTENYDSRALVVRTRHRAFFVDARMRAYRSGRYVWENRTKLPGSLGFYTDDDPDSFIYLYYTDHFILTEARSVKNRNVGWVYRWSLSGSWKFTGGFYPDGLGDAKGLKGGVYELS